METRFSIEVPALFEFEECMWFLDRNYDDCLIQIKDHSIYKLIPYEKEVILIRIFSSLPQREIFFEFLQGEITPETISFVQEYIQEWFDLKRDLHPFYELLKKDSRLSYMTETFQGLRLIGIPDLFEALSWCIIGQQINLTFAYTLKRRLVERYGLRFKFQNQNHYLFPTPSDLAIVSPEELRELQFSQRKAEYIIGVANAFTSGKISKQKLEEISNFEARQKFLTELKGVGIWTANYSLMKSLREPSCIPYGDVGLWNALEFHKIIENRNQTDKLTEFFEPYKGWESYLVFYLWRSLSKA